MALELTPTLETDIADKRAEISSKEAEIVAQEVHTTRVAYIAAVQPLQAQRQALQGQLQTLIEQNEAIIAANVILTAEYVPPLAEYKVIAQDAIKAECKAHILDNYDVETQRNVGMDIYPFETSMSISQFIADCIGEENRCHAAIDAATTIAEVYAVTATFPEVT